MEISSVDLLSELALRTTQIGVVIFGVYVAYLGIAAGLQVFNRFIGSKTNYRL